MRSHQSSSHAFFLWAFIVPCGLTFLASPSLVFAEDQTNEPGGKAQRKQQLERQLKSILDELDDLKQGDRPAPVQPLPVQPEPQAMTEPQIEQGRRGNLTGGHEYHQQAPSKTSGRRHPHLNSAERV